MIVGEQVAFYYTGKDGNVTERRGKVVPNSKTVSTVIYFTIRTPEGQIRSFERTRLLMSTFPYVL